MADIPFNPLDKRNLGESVASALLKRAAELPENPEAPSVLEKRIADFLEGKAVPIMSTEEAVMTEENDREGADG